MRILKLALFKRLGKLGEGIIALCVALVCIKDTSARLLA